MTIQGAIAELQYLLEVDDVPFYYKGSIEKVIETIQMEMAERKDEPQTDYDKGLKLFADILFDKEKSEQFLKECKAMGIEPQTDCNGCQHYADEYTADACYECKRSYADCYEPLTERSE